MWYNLNNKRNIPRFDSINSKDFGSEFRCGDREEITGFPMTAERGQMGIFGLKICEMINYSTGLLSPDVTLPLSRHVCLTTYYKL